MTTTDPTARCRVEYVRPSGRERGDRIVECVLPAGHEGLHQNDTGTMWRIDRDPDPTPEEVTQWDTEAEANEETMRRIAVSADPTAPATPGEALRWAAERITARLIVSPEIAAQAVVAWLDVWARDLDAARATDPAPATPPAGTECTRCGQDIDPSLTAIYGGPDAPRHGTCPPAGTAPASATAVDPPAGTVTL